ncbi:MAG: DUF4340 domain-containing protein [Caldilineaceae bacterium]|nr:DUF4340 domain-containing protein [Caldilineaceae bacterium]
MNRQNQILAGILVLQVALAAFIFWPGRNATATAPTLFEGINLDAIQSITVSEQDKQIKVSRSGDGWGLPEAEDFPATTLYASDTISKVLTIDTRRLVASTATSHSRLQVTADDFVRRVDLETTDGQTLTLYVGSSPSFRSTNVRRADSDNVYLTSSLTTDDLRTDYGSWIDTSYLAIPEPEIQALTIENAQGTVSFTRPTTDTWTLSDLAPGETFNQNNLTSLLTRFTGFNMVKPLGKTEQPIYGMTTPTATVTLQTQPAGGEAKTITLLIGQQDPATQNYIVKSSESEYYVEVAAFGVENILNRGRADYLTPPEASTSITDTNFITDFGEITATTPISAVAPITTTEAVTPAQ